MALECPDCGGPVETNPRKRSPKSPDYICASGCQTDKGYPVGVWTKPREARSGPNRGGGGARSGPAPSGGPALTWKALEGIYKGCHKLALAEHPKATPDAVVTASNCLFIEARRAGLLDPYAKRKEPRPEPAPVEDYNDGSHDTPDEAF